MLDTSQDKSYARWNQYTVEMRSSDMNALFSHIVGKVLTIIDASYSDVSQREAVKSIVKDALWGTSDALAEWMHDNQVGTNERSTFPFGVAGGGPTVPSL